MKFASVLTLILLNLTAGCERHSIELLPQWTPPSGALARQPHPLATWQTSRDAFSKFQDHQVQHTRDAPISTFSIDVDTASYGFARRLLKQGQLPPQVAVRVEEFINYFNYDYPPPDTTTLPNAAFRPTIHVMPCPWNTRNKLIHIGLQGDALTPRAAPGANLVFLIDVSGSMRDHDKLPLVRESLRLMVEQLKPADILSIVTYAGTEHVLLPPTNARNKERILGALAQLRAGGSTAGGAGLKTAYDLAERNFAPNRVNRVILATDGDFNVGTTDHHALQRFIADKRRTGVFLSVLGFGQGNYHDNLMQRLAQHGNGVAAYIDTVAEARKVLVTELRATVYPIAKDVKIQVEFNPHRVASYRLIGYEQRALSAADFANDEVDAGEIGSGHRVTALYEITELDAANPPNGRRYQPALATGEARYANEYAWLKLRYIDVRRNERQLLTQPITQTFQPAVQATEARFATAVAAFAQRLRGVAHVKDFEYDDILALAANNLGSDPHGYRAEFLQLVRLAKASSTSSAR